MNFDLNERILYCVLLFLWSISEIFVGRWMFRAKPQKHRADKYPKGVIFLSQLPFGSGWKKSIDEEDIPAFEKYQSRIRIMFLSTLFPLFVMYIFLH